MPKFLVRLKATWDFFLGAGKSRGDEKTDTSTPDYPKLPARPFASLKPEEYIQQRLNQALSWYDKSATGCKKWYLWMRALSVVSAALVPFLLNVEFEYREQAVTIFSTVVVLLVSLESVFHYREQWVNYRSTEQYLRKEYFLFTAKEGDYANLAGKKEAYRTFVQRVEQAIDAENASTLQVMTATSESGKSHGASTDSSPPGAGEKPPGG